MKRRLLVLVGLVAEPVCHLFGIPHPEGLGQLALSYLAAES